ncbi:MAG TPA: AI-2E family transporter [Gemmatimonadales bacterium]|nr:AI-2E family transporter [Gemmatimonadales bacterium]
MVVEERPGWRSRDILRAVAIVAGFYIAMRLLWVGRSVLLLAFLGVLFGLALTAGVDWLERRRIPRGLGAIALVFGFFGILAGLGAVTAPSITGQLQELKTQLPQAITKIQTWVRERQQGVTQVLEQVAPDAAPAGQGAKPDTGAPGAGRQPGRAGQGQEPERQEPAKPGGEEQGEGGQGSGGALADQLGGVGRFAFGFFSSTLAALAGFILILFVAIFVAVDARTYHKGLMHLFPHRIRPRAGEVLSSTATMLRRWLLTQFVAMVAVGTLTAVVLLLLDVKAAIGLGIIAGILEFVPIAGPIIAAIPGIAMSFLDGPEKAVYVTLAYIAIQQVEANLITPLLMKRGLELPPVLTITTQGVLSLVFGFVGLLVAVPMLAAAIVPIKMLYVQDVVGDQVALPGDDKGKEKEKEEDPKGG